MKTNQFLLLWGLGSAFFCLIWYKFVPDQTIIPLLSAFTAITFVWMVLIFLVAHFIMLWNNSDDFNNPGFQ